MVKVAGFKSLFIGIDSLRVRSAQELLGTFALGTAAPLAACN